jgi:heme-degrading monooxygenase HmoA
MYVVIVHHWCKPDMVEQARMRIDSNGEAMSRCKGFIARYRMEKPDEPLKISTVTVWADSGANDAWQSQKKSAAAGSNAPSPYERWQNEAFHVAKFHPPAH